MISTDDGPEEGWGMRVARRRDEPSDCRDGPASLADRRLHRHSQLKRGPMKFNDCNGLATCTQKLARWLDQLAPGLCTEIEERPILIYRKCSMESDLRGVSP